MRLWHEQMIDNLPKNQLLGQHREHNAAYLMGCIENLQKKGIQLEL